MELIAELTDEALGFKPVKVAGYRIKRAVRNVILDRNGRVVLVYWKEPKTYILPGGRPESGESLAECAKREAREETGYNIKVDKKLGAIIMIRSRLSEIQICYCFLSHTMGSQKPLKLESDEDKEGISVEYAKTINKAIKMIGSKGKGYDNKFRSKRDMMFLQKAKK